MSVWQQSVPSSLLSGVEGDLLSVRITVEAFLLEDLLEALAEAPFPINPDIRHHAHIETSRGTIPAVHVDFPAWRSQVAQLEELVLGLSFEARLFVSSMIEEIRA